MRGSLSTVRTTTALLLSIHLGPRSTEPRSASLAHEQTHPPHLLVVVVVVVVVRCGRVTCTLTGPLLSGSDGDVSKCGSGSSSEGLHRRPGNGPWAAVRRTQSAADVAGHRPHPPPTGRSSSDRLGRRPAVTPSNHSLHSQSGAWSSEDLAARFNANAGRHRTYSAKPLWRSGSLRHSPVSNSAPSLSTSDLPPRGWGAAGPGAGPMPAPEGRAECWSIKQFFCVGSADDLPESLV